MSRSALFIVGLLLLSTLVDAGNVNPASLKNRKKCTACKKKRHGPPADSQAGSSPTVIDTAQTTSLEQLKPTTTITLTTKVAPTATPPTPPQQGTSSSTEDPEPSQTPATNDTSPGISASSASGRLYHEVERYEGRSFFDGFDFQNIPDPTHGNVNYLAQDGARGAGLAYVQDDGIVVMKVDDYSQVAPGGLRNSVRIQSKREMTTGLLVLDVLSMPFGCGVWPAFWTVGENWPAGGEIDILEGVHDGAHGHYTLHTAPGCQIDQNLKAARRRSRRHVQSGGSSGHLGHAGTSHHSPRGDTSPLAGLVSFSGKVLTPNCDATINSNTGCGIQDPSTESYGSALNKIGGGMFATLIDEHGVAIWFFPRHSIPKDLEAGMPRPATWGIPKAFWSSSQCPTHRFFGPQRVVINTTLCGDWAGATYSSAGCPGTCGDRIADPNNFRDAQWKIKSVAIYE